MDYVGIDVHKKDSQICIVAEGGELIERRVRTEVGRLADSVREAAARPDPHRSLHRQ